MLRGTAMISDEEGLDTALTPHLHDNTRVRGLTEMGGVVPYIGDTRERAPQAHDILPSSCCADGTGWEIPIILEN